jgi:hypothetical protein
METCYDNPGRIVAFMKDLAVSMVGKDAFKNKYPFIEI